MKDAFGNEYLNIEQAKEGMKVWTDFGFTCVRIEEVELFDNFEKAYFLCDDGRHMIDGQCDDSTGCCIGLYISKPEFPSWFKKKVEKAHA